MQALHDIVKAGYVRYIGMSSCYAWQCERFLSSYPADQSTLIVDVAPIIVQVMQSESPNVIYLAKTDSI